MGHKKTSTQPELASQEWVQTQNNAAVGTMQDTIISDVLGDGEIIGGIVTCSESVLSGTLSAIGNAKNDTTKTGSGIVAVSGTTNVRFVLDTLKSQDVVNVVLRDYKEGGSYNRNKSVKDFKLYVANTMPVLTHGDVTNLTHISDNTLLVKYSDILTIQEFTVSKKCRYIVIDATNNYGGAETGLRTFNARLTPNREYSSLVESYKEADLYNPNKVGAKITIQNPIAAIDSVVNANGDLVTYSTNLYYKTGFTKYIPKAWETGGYEPKGGDVSTQTPAWAMYKFGTVKPVNGIRIICTMPTMQPKQFKVYGSTGTTWVEVFSHDKDSGMVWREWKSFWFGSTYNYKYWKIEQTETRTTVYTEIEFLHRINLQTEDVIEELDVVNKKYFDIGKQQLTEALAGIGANNQTTFRSWQGTQNTLLYSYLNSRILVGMNGTKPRIKINNNCEGTLIKMRCETFTMENSTTYISKVGSSTGFQAMQKDQDYYPQLDSSTGFSLTSTSAYELPRNTGLHIQLSVKNELRVNITTTRDINDDWEMQINAIKF